MTAFTSFNAAWPSEIIRAQAVAIAAKTTFADITNAVELQRLDLGGVAGPIGGTKGGFIKSLTAIPLGTVSSGGVQLMLLSSLDNGVTVKLKRSVLMPAYTFTTTSQVPLSDFGWTESALTRLAGGERWWIGTSITITGGVEFSAEGDGFG